VFDTITVFVGFIIPVPVHSILFLCKHGEMTIRVLMQYFLVLQDFFFVEHLKQNLLQVNSIGNFTPQIFKYMEYDTTPANKETTPPSDTEHIGTVPHNAITDT